MVETIVSAKQIESLLVKVERGESSRDSLRALVNTFPAIFSLGAMTVRICQALYDQADPGLAVAQALIQDEAPGIRYSAALELPIRLPHGQREPWLLEAARQETDPAGRRAIWLEVYRSDGYLVNGQVLAAVLQRGLADTDPLIRGSAVRLAGTYRVQEVYQVLDTLADNDPDLRVRAAAIQALQCYAEMPWQSASINRIFEQTAAAELLVATGRATLQALADAGNLEAADGLAACTYIRH